MGVEFFLLVLIIVFIVTVSEVALEFWRTLKINTVWNFRSYFCIPGVSVTRYANRGEPPIFVQFKLISEALLGGSRLPAPLDILPHSPWKEENYFTISSKYPTWKKAILKISTSKKKKGKQSIKNLKEEKRGKERELFCNFKIESVNIKIEGKKLIEPRWLELQTPGFWSLCSTNWAIRALWKSGN